MDDLKIILTIFNGVLVLGTSIYAGYITWVCRYCRNTLAKAVMWLLLVSSLAYLVRCVSLFNYALGLSNNSFTADNSTFQGQTSLSITCLGILISFLLFEAMRGLYIEVRKAEDGI